MVTIPTLPATPPPLTLMSVHVLLTVSIIISFHSAELGVHIHFECEQAARRDPGPQTM